MSIFSSLYNAVSGYVSGVKNKVVGAWGTLRESTEEFIGDIVIKSAVTRLKTGVNNFIDTMDEPEVDNASSEEAVNSASTGKRDSPSLMTSLLSGGAASSARSRKPADNPLEEFMSEMGENLSAKIKQAVKKKVESISPEDVMAGLAGVMSSTMSSFKNNANEADGNAEFKMDAFMQILGVMLAALGGFLLASSLNQPASAQAKTNADEVSHLPSLASVADIEDDTPATTMAM